MSSWGALFLLQRAPSSPSERSRPLLWSAKLPSSLLEQVATPAQETTLSAAGPLWGLVIPVGDTANPHIGGVGALGEVQEVQIEKQCLGEGVDGKAVGGAGKVTSRFMYLLHTLLSWSEIFSSDHSYEEPPYEVYHWENLKQKEIALFRVYSKLFWYGTIL